MIRRFELSLIYVLVYYGHVLGWGSFAVGLGFTLGGWRLPAICSFALTCVFAAFNLGLSLGRAGVPE